jgi:hypothetical protein
MKNGPKMGKIDIKWEKMIENVSKLIEKWTKLDEKKAKRQKVAVALTKLPKRLKKAAFSCASTYLLLILTFFTHFNRKNDHFYRKIDHFYRKNDEK